MANKHQMTYLYLGRRLKIKNIEKSALNAAITANNFVANLRQDITNYFYT